jgi:fumarate hydratase class II
VVEASDHLKTIAVSLFKIANTYSLARERPALGAPAKFNFPRRNLAAPIMPGKVNPVMCESVMMVCAQVIGNDAITTRGWPKRRLRTGTRRCR